ncbi:MAG: PLP-dependent lyase/thiolase [Patescibacteria group bacterium]
MVTPHEQYLELAQALGYSNLYFKREDLHPYGSHKGRSIPVMIDWHYKGGDRRFGLSSSGNAALAAALYTKEMNSRDQEKISLDIYVGLGIDPHKLERVRALADEHIRIFSKERPRQALTEAMQKGVRSLRQTTDDVALIGYVPLAEELLKIGNVGAVFIGTSSGTTAQSLARFFKEKNLPTQVHIIQTSSCHPLADAFEPYDGPNEKSIADAITDITAQRRFDLTALINENSGFGWYASNKDIRTAQELVEKHTGLKISTNSALSVVGAMHAAYRGWEIKGNVVCMICGE